MDIEQYEAISQKQDNCSHRILTSKPNSGENHRQQQCNKCAQNDLKANDQRKDQQKRKISQIKCQMNRSITMKISQN